MKTEKGANVKNARGGVVYIERYCASLLHQYSAKSFAFWSGTKNKKERN